MSEETEAARRDLSGLKLDREPIAIAAGPRRWPWVALAVVGLGVAAFVYWRSTRPAPALQVETFGVPRSGSAELLQAAGYIRAQVRSEISSKVIGIVSEINFKEGDRVRKGDVIARLENRDLAARVGSAEANLEMAKLDEQRLEALVKANSRPQADLDRARTARERVEHELADARAQLDYTTIIAPFDGLVVRKNAERGQSVSSVSAASLGVSGSVVTLIDPTTLQAEVDVNEAHKDKIAIGMPCEVILEGLPSYRGEVASRIPLVDRAKSTIMVKVAITTLDEKILEGMSVRVKFLPKETVGEAPAIFVPESCVVDGRFVWIVQGDALEQRDVIVGETKSGKIEIRRGLDGGEQVVTHPDASFNPGMKVKPR